LYLAVPKKELLLFVQEENCCLCTIELYRGVFPQANLPSGNDLLGAFFAISIFRFWFQIAKTGEIKGRRIKGVDVKDVDVAVHSQSQALK
jgi:hypothetical protein